MEILELLLKQFETFVKRSLLPSSSFLMFFLLYDLAINHHRLIDFLEKKHNPIMIVVIIIIFIGLSNLLTILHQFIYDNNIKGNYDAKYLFRQENFELIALREKVISTLSNERYSDYLLYQIIGKKMKEFSKPINTTRYIDDIKSIGILFISLLIVIFISVVHFVGSNTDGIIPWVVLLFAPFLIIALYFLGKELILSKYRSRAIRIYTNYLEEVASS